MMKQLKGKFTTAHAKAIVDHFVSKGEPVPCMTDVARMVNRPYHEVWLALSPELRKYTISDDLRVGLLTGHPKGTGFSRGHITRSINSRGKTSPHKLYDWFKTSLTKTKVL